MPSYLIACIGMWSILGLLLAGCNFTDPVAASGNTQEDIFRARSVPVLPNPLPTVRAVNEAGGNIVIIAARSDEIAADAVETGTGTSAELARIEAQEHIALANSAGQVQIQALPDARQQLMNPADHALLHARVPPNTPLTDLRTHQGNIEVYGAVGDVTATISNSGDIAVMGGNGNVNLLTEHGSIRVDLAPGKRIAARAAVGNIDIIASDAVVSAVTTEGHVSFIGMLRSGEAHAFTTSKGGNVTVAVPAYPAAGQSTPQPTSAIYRVYAQTSANPIVVDLPAGQRDNNAAPLAICGVIHGPGPYDYHIESTTFQFGRLEISPALTTTFFFTGTLTPTYYRFDTTRPQLSLFAPRSQAIHIYTAADLAQIAAGTVPVDADCAVALQTDLSQAPAVVIHMRSDSGRIFLHHIDFVK